MKEISKNIAYFFLDCSTLFKGVKRNINGFTVLFPAKWSRFYNNDYEKETFEFFKSEIKKGNTILDIGAHIGLYAAPLSSLTGELGKVYCFEPTPETFKVLSKTVKINKLTNVKCINAAVTETTGKINFNLTSLDGKGSNANSIVETERTKNSVEVHAYSIDDFRLQNKLKIDVLKIDVEGAELNALKGAQKTFIEDRPLGILALHPESITKMGHSLEEIWDLMQQYNLNVFYKNKDISKTEFCSNTLLFDVEFKPR